MPVHVCPICGASHAVSAIRAELAYGRQLACSGECEAVRRRRRRERYWHLPRPLPGNDSVRGIVMDRQVTDLKRVA